MLQPCSARGWVLTGPKPSPSNLYYAARPLIARVKMAAFADQAEDRERLLFSELVATRRQVDKLLEQQQVLIALVAASHPSLAGAAKAGAASSLLGNAGALGAALGAGAGVQAPVAQQPEAVHVASPQRTRARSAGSGSFNPSFHDPADDDAAGAGSDILAALSSVTGSAVAPVPASTPAARASSSSSSSGSAPAALAGVSLPLLREGDKSGWWMEKLHVALLARGYYAGDEDVQSWMFGKGTREALEDFQTDEKLPVTGVADATTWSSLLSTLPELTADLVAAVQSGAAPRLATTVTAAPAAPKKAAAPPPQPVQQPRPQAPPQPRQPLAPSPIAQQVSSTTSLFASSEAPGTGPGAIDNPSFNPIYDEPLGQEEGETAEAAAARASSAAAQAGPTKAAVDGKPPRLERGDRGGFFVETLHAALLRAGYDPSFRDVEAVAFGRGTDEAVRAAQQARKLPETGVVDDVTWAVLLAPEPDLRAAFVQAVVMGAPEPAPASSSEEAEAAAAAAEASLTAGSATGGDEGGIPDQPLPRSHAEAGPAGSASFGGGAEAAGASERAAVAERTKEAQDGLPPALCAGDDDIAWVSRLHRALVAAGFYPSDEECEEWLFEGGTQEAVLAAQASLGLAETGVVCVATWGALLEGEGAAEVRAEVEAACGGTDVVAAGRAARASGSSSSSGGSASATFSQAATSTSTSTSTSTGPGSSEAGTSSSASGSGAKQWPVVMEGDGNQAVHVMQLALGAGGYSCGEDEEQWWQFGEGTLNALKTFQACSGLPESGVCDARTWQALVVQAGGQPGAGPEALDALGADLMARAGSESSEVDMTGEMDAGRVWLLGEQRWETRKP
eukprot:CAMPEP_0202860282 /NCGR_PEP_ID=MMETSP1391-20130828/2052_1 /ASSEMBLY_ACC=CAM_ASM_000867 /TAXON_ID=1034604 /ORGANISM="Chlamydomonas leiostraca, Strain SAG 11-49" /LENGTH=848 /DNA_ID=CAMNT_0049539425 /DNA_START=123 /DNA_END=2669 /DNA_ORIENTATION=-